MMQAEFTDNPVVSRRDTDRKDHQRTGSTT
jgi:hypothetical protein